jgi:hypothetical protein
VAGATPLKLVAAEWIGRAPLGAQRTLYPVE